MADGVPVRIPAGVTQLDGDLALPPDGVSVVLFAHGSGSSRHSPRNRAVAAALNRAGHATLLLDLLSEDEDALEGPGGGLRFDVELLARRLSAAADWLTGRPQLAGLPLFVFGASTGAAAALITAAQLPELVRGVVSRGGRPDLAGDALGRVRAPVLLIVGGNDPTVLHLNEHAQRSLAAAGTTVELAVVPGASHLFEEPGALEAVVELTLDELARWRPA